MQTFQESIETLDQDEKPSILLANGFSQAWNAEIFNYASLFAAADFGDREYIIRPLFNNLATYDFENVAKQLTSAENVLRAYDPENALIEQITRDKETLKNVLIQTISNTHPNLPSEVADDQYVSVRIFLSQFSKVFSVNYDLLFYWARNKDDLAPSNYKTDDGFRKKLCWEGYGTQQDVYFLHGGLHIYDAGHNIKKHAYVDGSLTIINQVRSNLQTGNFPLFVSEPTYEKKKSRIEHNPYLSCCFRALGNLKGTLFIHGHSMDENDKHIFDKIKSSQINKIFVSIYGDEHNAANTRTKANALAFLKNTNNKIYFYQAESAPIWV